MKTASILVLITVGTLAQVGAATAGHEWIDGTMGPRGQSYDTTMPIFPTAKRVSPKSNEEPSQACDSRTLASTSTGASATVTHDLGQQPHQDNAKPMGTATEREICRR